MTVVVLALARRVVSERVARLILELLPPGERESTIVLTADAAALGVLVTGELTTPDGLRLRGDTVMMVEDAPAVRAAVAAVRSVRWLVWCEDDESASAWTAENAAPLVADTLDSCAWEVVRCLAGDRRAVVSPLVASEEEPLPVAAGMAASEPRSAVSSEERAALPSAPEQLDRSVTAGKPDAGRSVVTTTVPETSAPPRGRAVPRPPAWAPDPEPATAEAHGADAPSRAAMPRLPAWSDVADGTPAAASASPVETHTQGAPVEPVHGHAERTAGVGEGVPSEMRAPQDVAARACERAHEPDRTEPDGPSPAFAAPAATPSTRSLRVVEQGEGEGPLGVLATTLPPMTATGAGDGTPPARSWAGRGIAQVRRRLAARGTLRADEREELGRIGRSLARARSTVVAVGTRAGGAGKSTTAAVLGVTGAQSLEPHGGRAVLVDCDTGKPDQWIKLRVPQEAVTVRDVLQALNAGRAHVPEGAYARHAPLRVLPDARHARVQERQEVVRLAAHLRERNSLVVADMAPALPSVGGGEREATVAHWVPHTDVWILATDLDETRLVAAAETLDALEGMTAGAGRPMPATILALLVRPGCEEGLKRRDRVAVLNDFRAAGTEVVVVPFRPELELGPADGQAAVIGVDARVTRAFLPLLSAVARVREAQLEAIQSA